MKKYKAVLSCAWSRNKTFLKMLNAVDHNEYKTSDI